MCFKIIHTRRNSLKGKYGTENGKAIKKKENRGMGRPEEKKGDEGKIVGKKNMVN